MELRNFRRSILGTAAFGALSMTGFAFAQTETEEPAPAAPQTEEAPATTPAPARTEGEARQDKIVVTGSLLRRDEFTSSSPIQVITAEIASLEGLVDTADILQGSSIAAGSTQINNQFGGFIVNGGPGVNSVSLRGLGAQRTLLLFNGRRFGPSGVEGRVGAVDLNTIPQSVVQRVEILKDGAGSIYGSDAVAGVINVITRREIDKPILNLSANVPLEGAGEAFSADGAFGLNFDDGFLTFSASYSKLEPLQRADRDYYSCAQDYVFDINSGARLDRIERNPLADNQGDFKCFNIGVVNSIDVNAAGGIRRFTQDPNASAGTNAGNLFPGFRLVGINGLPLDGPVGNPLSRPLGTEETDTNDPRQLAQDILPSTERMSAYVTGEYNLGGIADIYGELLYNNRTTDQTRFRQFFPWSRPGSLPLSFGSNDFVPFNTLPNNCPTTVGGPATGSCGTQFNLVRPIALIPFNTSVDIDYWYGVAGARGDLFGTGWSWDAHLSHSISDGSYTRDTVDVRNVVDATDPRSNLLYLDDGLGNIGGYRIVGNSIVADPTAVPINYFSSDFLAGNLSAAERDFLFDTDTGNTEFTQTLFNAVVSGELFELPAGKIGAALGVEYRKSEIDDQPGPLSFGNNQWGLTSAVNTTGQDELYEAFAEVEVPLIAGQPFFDSLTFNGSLRWFDYELYDADTVYKVGLNWQINPMMRLRATKGTSFRAPGLFELYLGNQTGFGGQLAIDPCINWATATTNPQIQANCAAEGIPGNYPGVGSSALIISGGGSGFLTPETSEATTIGAIFSPTAIDLSIAVDYFEIQVDNQVAQLGAGAILGGCYGGTNFPNAFCDLFTRGTDPNLPNFQNVLTVNNNFINVNKQSTRGLDVTGRYEHEFSFGDLTVDLTGTWTFEDETELFQGVAGFRTNDFNGSLGQPDFVADGTVQFQKGDWTYFWSTEFVSRMSNDEIFGNSQFNFRGTNGLVPTYFKQFNEPYATHTASVRYSGDDWQAIVGVSNLFDEHPPFVSTGTDNTLGNSSLSATQVDLRGRSAFVRLSKEF